MTHLKQDIISRAKKQVRIQGGLWHDCNLQILFEGVKSLPLLLFVDELCSARPDIKVTITKKPSDLSPLFISDSLEDVAGKVFSSFLAGDADSIIKRSQHQNIRAPFREIPQEEIFLFAKTCGFDLSAFKETNVTDPERFLSDLKKDHPSICFSLTGYQKRLNEIFTQIK